MVVLPFVLYMVMPQTSGSGLRRYTLYTGLGFVGLFLLGVVLPLFGWVVFPGALGQRVAFAMWYAWILVLAFNMARDDASSMTLTI